MGLPRTFRRLNVCSITRPLPTLPASLRLNNNSLRYARWSSSQSIEKLVFSDHDGAEPSALRHLHLSSSPSDQTSGAFTSYSAASDFQTSLRQVFLDWKTSPTARAPSPLVVSFTPTPTYTLGRRQKSLTPEQLNRLKRPLSVQVKDSSAGAVGSVREYTPEVMETDRGGLTTYHGPGQMVLWPILDLHSPYYPPLTVRSYARLLEETTQAVLADGPSVKTYLSEEDPGVWAEAARSRTGGQERKIAAMGVHLRRHISGLGTALNVDVVVDGDEASNPWARFVPCGLEGKTATSVRAEVGERTWEKWRAAGDAKTGIEWYARRWVEELARRLGVKAAAGTMHKRLE